jgi:hypothetical protein
MAKMAKKAAYAMFEKKEPKATKKVELKKGESKTQIKKEVKMGMGMMKKKAAANKMGKK